MVSGCEVNVVYHAADLRALYRACSRCKRNALVALIAIPAFFAFLSFKDGARGVNLAFVTLPYFLIILTVMLVAYFLLPLNAVRVRRNNGWAEPMAVGLTDQGIATHHPNQESLFYWSKIQNVVVQGGRLLLFTAPSCAIILPRRCFLDDEQFTSWAERAEQFWRESKNVTVE